MTTHQRLETAVMQQLAGLSGQCDRHLTEVERDLVQTSLLLKEAIDKLGASFRGIHAAISVQQEQVELLRAGALAPEQAARMQAAQDELDAHIRAAITGLQFQDMTDQLIDRTVRRVAGLKDVLSTAWPPEQERASAQAQLPMESLLHSLQQANNGQMAKLEAVANKSVAQTHMQSGDIELF